ncbi:hypothetical protein [Amycolatopsis sp. CA-126428]|uniref:hypothetical protein n=1 Tax=Amycolatopsis sp. CA-126428 TaxID=2073158 RepID=UPI000CD31457|nr:hypothetical protein [Amycolatopsis sp. CA-126428]
MRDAEPVHVIPASPGMGRWTAAIEGDEAIFTCFSAGAAPHELLPHVRPGRSVLVPASSLAGLEVAVEAVLAARPDAGTRGGHNLGRWSQARVDRVAYAVYFDGPVRAGEGDGYRPVRTFFVALRDLRGLRVRLAAYLAIPQPELPPPSSP